MVLLSPGHGQFVVGGQPQWYPVVESLTATCQYSYWQKKSGVDENIVVSQGETRHYETAFNLSLHRLPPAVWKGDFENWDGFLWSTSGIH